jgi:hypothetical protein
VHEFETGMQKPVVWINKDIKRFSLLQDHAFDRDSMGYVIFLGTQITKSSVPYLVSILDRLADLIVTCRCSVLMGDIKLPLTESVPTPSESDSLPVQEEMLNF